MIIKILKDFLKSKGCDYIIFEKKLKYNYYSEIMKRAETMIKILVNNIYKSYTNEKKETKHIGFQMEKIILKI